MDQDRIPKAYHTYSQALDSAARVNIDLPHAGESFTEPSLIGLQTRLLGLRALGYQFPDHVLDDIQEEMMEELRMMIPPVRICITEDCGWCGIEDETVHPKHDPSVRLCPRCHNTTENLVIEGLHTPSTTEPQDQVQEDNELLPCPFCGGPAEVDRTLSRYEYCTGGPNSIMDYGHTVYCTRCEANLGGLDVTPPNTWEEAVAAWNQRKKGGEE